MEIGRASETSMNSYRTTRRHIFINIFVRTLYLTENNKMMSLQNIVKEYGEAEV
jgi:ribosomal protein L28